MRRKYLRGRGAQAVSRGAAQVIDRGAQAVARGAARCASQVLDRGAQTITRGAATLSQQEKKTRRVRARTE